MSDPLYAGGGIGLGPRPAPAAAEPYPEPEIRSHPWRPDDVSCCPFKKAVAALAEKAEMAGWHVQVSHARGCFPNQYGRPGPQLDSLAVRMVEGERRAVAVYRAGGTWTWQTIMVWTASTFPKRIKNITELEALL